MLGRSNVVANLAVKDVGRSRAFFTDTLGLEEVGNKGDDMVFLKSGDCVDKIYRSDYAGTNKADAVTWEVDNIDKKVEALKARGVTFEHYDIAGLELDGDVHVGGAVKIAWFKDPGRQHPQHGRGGRLGHVRERRRNDEGMLRPGSA
jgi:catechol 2,3-dioxygenase-like lactoylglutathione lyase family enzyme